MGTGTITGAAGNNPQLRARLIDYESRIGQLESRGSSVATPPANPPGIAVLGQDGNFTVTLTPPPGAASGVMYWLESSLTLQFDGAGAVFDYGPSLQTSWSIKQPNQYRYFRVKASYDGVNWQALWTYFVDPTICGPAPVNSGLVLTTSLALVDSATTPNGSSPLTQDGTTLGIIIANSQWKSGAQVINYTGAEIFVASYTTWYVYADDPNRKGGLPAGGYHATTNQSDLTAAEGRVYFGKITLSAGGGGSGTGGGGGGCTVMGTLISMHDGSKKPVEQLKVGDILRGLDGGPEALQVIDLLTAPVFRVTTKGGKAITASGDHPIQRALGGFEKLRFWVPGELTKMDDGKTDAIDNIVHIGNRLIFRLHLDRGKTYIAGGFPSHNMVKGF